MMPSVFSLNCSLGLFNKLNIIKTTLEVLKPQIVFLQESEVLKNDRFESYKIKNYEFICSIIKDKNRLVAYVRSDMVFSVKVTISEVVELIMIEGVDYQIAGYYRPFKLVNHNNHLEYMIDTTKFLREKINLNKKIIIVGDFNLDQNHINTANYSHRKVYDAWLDFVDEIGLVQHIKETTWRRKVNEEVRESVLDHVYTNFEDLQPKLMDSLMSDHFGIIIKKGLEEKRVKRTFL